MDQVNKSKSEMTPVDSAPNNIRDSYQEADKVQCKTEEHANDQVSEDHLAKARKNSKDAVLLKKLLEMQKKKEVVDGKLQLSFSPVLEENIDKLLLKVPEAHGALALR